MPKVKPILLVSSAVYGSEELLERLYAILDGLGFEVWMSHKGTVPIHPEVSALESCRRAVKQCDLFLSIILPRYGSGRESRDDDSITHEELRHAISLNKPRWVLVHEHVVVVRNLLLNLNYETAVKRQPLPALNRHKPPLDDWRIIDMYELAMRNDIELVQDRHGNWAQTYTTTEDALLFATSQFRRFQEAEAFVRESIGEATALVKAVNRRGGTL